MEDSYSSHSHSHSHSHSKAFSSKKAYNNNADGFNACDDVFGGPPNFGVTAFAPRAEDYTEIFGNFRSSRASSIPILDLPPVDDAVVSFDVWSSNFDYAEVFSGFHAVDFAMPFDELFKHSEGHGGDSSEEAWNAAGIESPSEESDLSTCLRKNHCFHNEAIPQSFDSKQFNVSYHRVDLGAREGKPDIIHVAQLNALPGYSYVVDEAASLERIEKDKLYTQATDDIIFSEDSSGNISEEQYVWKIFSNPSHSGMRISSFSRDHRPGGAHDTGGAPPNPPFISISDICLRTQPSHLPPPSRPPPVLAERKRDSNRMTSDARAPRTSISEITFDESLPHFFDVDASSSAAASAAAMEKAMEEAQEKLRTVKEMMVKKDSPQRLTKPGLQNSVNGEEKVRMIIDDECPVKDARQQAKQGEHEDGKCSGKGTQGAQKDAPSLPGLYEQSAHVSVKPSQRKHREHSFSGDLVLTEEAGEWKESMPYYEFINNDNSSSATQLENYEEYLLQGTNAYKPGNDNGKAVAFEEQEDSGERIKAAKKTHEWGKNAVSMNSVKGAYEPEENRWKLKATKASSRQEYHEKMVKVAQSVHDRVVHKHVQNEKSLNEASEGNRNEKKLVIDNQLEENNRRVDQAPQQADSDKNEKHSLVQEEKDRRLREALEREEFKNKVNEACKGEDNERRSKEALEGEENEKRVKKTSEREEIEINLGIAVRQEYKKKSEKMFVLEENEKRCKEATKEEGGKRIKEACVREGYVVKEAWDRARTERNLEEAVDLQQSDKILKEAAEVDKCKKHDDMGEEKNRKRPDENLGPVANDKKVEELQKRDEDEKKFKRNLGLAEFIERSMLPCEREETGRAHAVIHEKEEQYSVCKDGLPILLEGMDEDSACCSEIGLNLPADVLNSSNEACSLEEKSVQLADRACKLEKPQGKAYAVQGEPVDVGIGKIGTEHGEEELNAVKMEDVLADERRTESILVQDSARNNSQEEDGMVEASESTHIDEKTTNLDRLCIGDGLAPEEEKEQVSNQCFVKEFNHEQGGRLKTVKEDEVLLEQVKETDRSAATQAVNGFTEHVRQTEPSQPVMLDRKESIQKRSQMPNINQTTERKAKIINDSFISKEKDKEERLKGEREVEGERLRQLEEEREREREREREKDRIAVVTLEGHERAAVERATAEARQRVMAEARERLERACAEVREKSEKASTEARLRAEHAAVERATAEAREHAIEKAVIERVNFEARERLDRSISDKFSSSSREMGMGRSCSFSITEKLDGGGGESAQRCRARLERHCRTVERVAKALAEKNMRDLLAQREQAERNRLAETLDADIKRWSSGKEGNLRALLSTLQYVLGPDSGWQPIPLTDVITAAAVKKAYRKATLCVHPDKLQQRGASIQQKYICEKVFDLLKDAWSKFNSEER